jgi:hypothetical protein
MTRANNLARRRASVARSAATPGTIRTYGIFSVIDGGAIDSHPLLVSDELLSLLEKLRVKATLAVKAHDLVNKYQGGAGKNHPSRQADFALWTERQDQWLVAAEAVASFAARNYHEVRVKADAITLDLNGVLGLSIVQDVLRLTGGDA